MPSVVNLNIIASNVVSSNSMISNGENLQFGWSAHQKRTYSIYNLGQFEFVPLNFNLIYDQDVLDFPVNDSDLMGGEMV